jgi:biotin carboxyl carrier protein
MKLLVLVNGRAMEIDAGRLDAVVEVEPGVYSVLLDGRSFELRAVFDKDVAKLEVEGRRLTAEVIDPRNRSHRERAALGGGRQNIVTPMPGKVVRVLVEAGDLVEVGQGVAVVEAMKMQNEMKALRTGVVVEVRVKDGDTVGAGDALVVLE